MAARSRTRPRALAVDDARPLVPVAVLPARGLAVSLVRALAFARTRRVRRGPGGALVESEQRRYQLGAPLHAAHGLLLVIDARVGVEPRTHLALAAARARGHDDVVTVLVAEGARDADDVERAVRDALHEHGFRGDESTIVRVALAAADDVALAWPGLRRVLDALDRDIPAIERRGAAVVCGPRSDDDRPHARFLRALLARLEPYTRLALVEGEGEAHATRFGGAPPPGHEVHPTCGLCGATMTFICQIDHARGFHRIPGCSDVHVLFMCREESHYSRDMGSAPTWLRFARAETITQNGPASTTTSGPRIAPYRVVASEGRSLPSFDEVIDDEELLATLALGASAPLDVYELAQLGGTACCADLGPSTMHVGGTYTSFIDGTRPHCQRCGARMHVLLLLPSDDHPALHFGDGGDLAFFVCACAPDLAAVRYQDT